MTKVLAVLSGLAAGLVVAEIGLRVISRFHAPVRYMVTTSDAPEQPAFQSLEAYLASRGDVVPHRDFLNYWNNAFGLHDVEFVVPEAAGPSDHGAGRLVHVRTRSLSGRGDDSRGGGSPGGLPRVDLDLLNFGIGGTGVWDYKLLFELAGPTVDPDLVVVNLYLGNDGPDLFARPPSFRRVPSSLRKFYLARYVVNVVRVATGLERQVATGSPRSDRGAPPNARGGDMVDPASPSQPDDRQLTGPIYTATRFPEIMWDEYRRFARPLRGPSLQRVWGPTLATLDLLRHRVAGQGRRLVIALYPSVLQVYPEARAQLEEELRQQPSVTGPAPIDVDPLRPNRVVLEYCRAFALACYDATADLIAASRESSEPLYKARDTHWTIRGNRVVAEAQARWLRPLVCPEARSGFGIAPAQG